MTNLIKGRDYFCTLNYGAYFELEGILYYKFQGTSKSISNAVNTVTHISLWIDEYTIIEPSISFLLTEAAINNISMILKETNVSAKTIFALAEIYEKNSTQFNMKDFLQRCTLSEEVKPDNA